MPGRKVFAHSDYKKKSQAGNSRFYPNLKVGAIFPQFSTFNVNMN